MQIKSPTLAAFEKWRRFLYEELTFTHEESFLHTAAHCERVLLYALTLGTELKLDERDLKILCEAAIFHDTRRFDDGYDVGHGKRAASYYAEFCKEHQQMPNKVSAAIMAFHDHDDEKGLEALYTLTDLNPHGPLLYTIFKDADALDRLRLGPDELDPQYLRTQEARKLLAKIQKCFAKADDMGEDLLKRLLSALS